MLRAATLGFVPLLFLLVLVSAPSLAGAQAAAAPAPAPRPRAQHPGAPARGTFWLGGGYGRGRASQYPGVEEAFTLNASGQRGPFLVSLRAAAVSSSIFDWSSDVGLLVGLASAPVHPFHIGAGVGLGSARATLGEEGRSWLTVPLELQFAWRFSRYAGVGLYGFASLNGTDTFGGATLGGQLGRLR